MIPKASYKLFGSLLFLHAVAFIMALNFHGIYLKDSFEYLHQAKNIVNHGSWYANDWKAITELNYFSFRPPLYACFIACIKFIVNSDYAVLFVQNILSILVLMMVYRIACHFQLLEGKRVLIIVGMVILFPIQLIMANMIMSEILFQFLLFGLFHFCLRFYFKATYFNAVGSALCIGLMLLTKPASLFIIVVVLAWMIYVLWKQTNLQKAFSFIIIPVLFWLITLIGVGIQQQHQTGYFHYTSMKPFNQLKFNARYVMAQKFGEGYAEQWTSASRDRVNQETPYKNRYELMQHIGDSVLMKYPLTFMKLTIKGCAAFMLDPGRHDIVAFSNLTEESYNGFFYELNNKGWKALPGLITQSSPLLLLMLLLIFLWNVLQVVLLIYFLINKNIPLFIRVLLIAFVFYIMMVTGLLGVARYRSAVFPELSLIILFAIHTFVHRYNNQTQRTQWT